MDAKKVTQDFLKGSLPIVEYRRLFDEWQELEAFLQRIVDDIKSSVGKIEPYPFPMDDGSVSMSNKGIDRLLAHETNPRSEYGLSRLCAASAVKGGTMRRIVDANAEERAKQFRLCSQARRIPYGTGEDDFWVCWLLLRIFVDKDIRGLLRFKGGTSLYS